MRAVTGAIVSSKPCSLLKAARVLAFFCDSATSHLPSSDAFTYLRAASDAASHHHHFRRELLRAHADGGVEREEKPRLERGGDDGERDVDSVVAAGDGSRHGPAAEVGLDAGEKKSERKKKKRKEGLKEEDTDAAGIASYIPASPEISSEKRKQKKQKHGDGGREASGAKEDAGFVGEVETGSERKKDKKKREKVRVKLEEEAKDVKEVVAQMAGDGAADQEIAGREKKKKKKKHVEEFGDATGVKEEKMMTDGDLGSEKKRKKKRGRGADDNNDLDQVEHTKKKQKKQS